MFGKKRIDFLVIGAQKCGTSSFYQYLSQNLMIEAAQRKEVHFFDLFYERGIKWYHSNFKFSRRSITGESSPFYILHPQAPQRILSYNPKVKIIALLRDPVERAISHYRMNLQTGRENLSFREALAQEEHRLAAPQDLTDPQCPLLVYSYKQRGLYAEQLEKWFTLFPKEQIMLLNYHQFFKNPWREIQAVYRFLDVAPYFGSTAEYRENVSSAKIDISAEDMEQLKSYFEGPNRVLAEKFGIEFER